MAQWITCWPVNQRVAGSIPNQGTCLGCGPGSQLGVGEATRKMASGTRPQYEWAQVIPIKKPGFSPPGKILVKPSQCKHQSRKCFPFLRSWGKTRAPFCRDPESQNVLPCGDSWRQVGQRSPPGPNQSRRQEAEDPQNQDASGKNSKRAELMQNGLQGGRARCSPHPAGGAISPAGLISKEKLSSSGLLVIYSTGLHFLPDSCVLSCPLG